MVNTINKVSNETREKIRKKSVLNLPNRIIGNPELVKQAFTGLVIDSNNSALGEIDRVVEEVNALFDYYDFPEIKQMIDEGIIEGDLKEYIEQRIDDTLLQKEQEYAPRLSTVESKVSNLEVGKRDKSVKITKNDMDISSNANKLGLENLQDEVIQAISGNAPVNNVIGDNAVVSEKIAEEAINIKHLNNDLKSLFFLNNKYGSDYSFVIGSFASNGLEAPATNRIRSEYITSTNPIIIELIDKIQFNMNVWLYSKEGVFIDRTGLTTEPFVLTNEYMARIVLSYKDNRNINEEDIPTLTNNLILKEQEVKLKDNSIGNSKIIDKAITPEKTNFFDISKNLINIDNAIIGYRLSSVNGELIEDSLYITTEFIEVEPNVPYYRSVPFLDIQFPIFWYDKDKGFISRDATGLNIATSPINAKYMRYANSAVNFYATMLTKGAEAEYEPYYVKLNEKLLPKKEDDYFTKSPNLYNKFNLQEGLGEAKDYASFPIGSLVSDYIEVKENVVYSKTPNAIHIIYYDKNKNAILGQSRGINTNTILMPFGTSFVRIRVIGENPNFMFNEGEELLPYEDYGYVLKSTNKRPIKIDESLIGDIEFDKETLKEEIINEINSQNALRPYPPLLEYTISNADYRYVDWMSDDGTILFGANGTKLRQSLTEGESWDLIKSFEGSISMVRQLKDGQLLVCVRGSGTTIRGHVLKSVNYDPQNPTATIFNKVLDLNIGSIYITGSWGISIYNNIIVMNEYGSKALPNNARYTYLSTDMGETWEVIFDLGAIEGAHLHGCCFDPYYSRIYISNGDGTNHRIRYSDDFGATWTIISDNYQPVSMLAFPSGVIMATDSRVNGILRIPRTSKEDVPQIIEAYHVEPTDTLRLCGQLIYQKPVPGSPAFISYTTTVNGGRGIVLATVDGIHFYEIFRDFQTYDSVKGMRALVGPTASGKLIGTLNDNRQASYSRIVANAPEWVK